MKREVTVNSQLEGKKFSTALANFVGVIDRVSIIYTNFKKPIPHEIPKILIVCKKGIVYSLDEIILLKEKNIKEDNKSQRKQE